MSVALTWVMLLPVLLCGRAGYLAAQPSLVILVRHAERDTTPAHDPVLTVAGNARAKELARILAYARVGSIIVTQYQRTRLTAVPVADAGRLTPLVIVAGGELATHVDDVAAAVRARPRGETVLVVGHTLTIPAIATALGAPKLPALCENDYSTLFVLHIDPHAQPKLLRARYGREASPDSDCSASLK